MYTTTLSKEPLEEIICMTYEQWEEKHNERLRAEARHRQVLRNEVIKRVKKERIETVKFYLFLIGFSTIPFLMIAHWIVFGY